MPHRAGAQQQRLAQRRATAAHSPPALSGVVRNAYAHRGPDVVRKTHTKPESNIPAKRPTNGSPLQKGAMHFPCRGPGAIRCDAAPFHGNRVCKKLHAICDRSDTHTRSAVRAAVLQVAFDFLPQVHPSALADTFQQWSAEGLARGETV